MKILTLLLVIGLAMPAWSVPPDYPSAEEQQITVSGTVLDASTGQGMPGVNILVQGTTVGAITDVNGKYSIPNVDRNANLVFSFIGYVSQTVAVSGRAVVDITLAAELTDLDEVVVVGYTTQKRANVVGAVTSIPGQSIAAIPSASVTTAISGRLPGSVVIQQSGEPGNLGARILVRGRSTSSSTDPLVVIDGIVGRSMGDVDPMDIESLSVLKDASASIYGTSAANGVILITTKKGAEGTPRLNYQFYQGFSTATIVPRTTNAYEFATMVTEYQVANSKTRQYDDTDIELYRTGADPWEHPDSDWYGDLIKDWTTNYKHTLTLDGGFRGVTYYLSLGLRGDDSFYAQSSTKYKQYNVRAKVELPVTDWFTLGYDFAGIQNDRVYPRASAYTIVGQATRLMPTQWSFWPNGLPGPDIEYGDNPVVTSTFATGKDEQKNYQALNTLKARISPPFLKGLSLSAQYTYDLTNWYRHRFFTPWILYFPVWSSAVRDPQTNFITSMDLTATPRGLSSPENHEDYSRTIRKTTNFDIQYTKKFGNHNIFLFGGFEQYATNYNNFYGFRKYYVSTLIQTLDAGGSAEWSNSGGMSIYARKSWIARATYDYQGKYLADLVFRADGSLKFPPDSRWGYFPAVLLGWRVSEEGFWKNNIPFINYFKLRASWGKMGLDPGSSFQYINKFALSTGNTFGTGTTVETTAYQSVVANPNITWEKQTTRNVGFDSKLLSDLLHLNFEFFFNTREDLLVTRDASVPNFTGLSLPQENIGEFNNRGFEVDAGIHKTFFSELRIDLTGNFSWNRNKVVFVDEPERSVAWQVRTGHPYGASLLYNAIGIFSDQAAVDAYPHWSTAKPGDVIFENVKADDQVINGDDRILVDHTDAPEIFYGTSLDASWKDFSLSVLIQGQGKYLRMHTQDERRGEAGNYFYWAYDGRWQEPGDVTDVARAYNRNDYYWGHAVNNSTYWYANMAYCRLKNLVLTYNIPSQLYKRLGISRASVYFSGNNLALLWAAQRNFDPEIGDPMQYPAMKTFAIGANVSF
ncbi:MAG: TonB-dependent receptor [Bacteroidales bacterium]|nr:TonB-dependent receptor [Bacteroidales bacterium]